jgi:formate/nitrite transporter FocA (FNT family)
LEKYFQEIFVTSQNKKKEKKETTEEQSALSKAWIPMRSGIVLISILSILMAVFTAWQVIPQKGWLEGILYGLLFGGLIWIVFLGMQLFYRFTGPKR